MAFPGVVAAPPATAAAGAARGRRYRYRGAAGSGPPGSRPAAGAAPAAPGEDNVRLLLRQQRQLISFKSSSLRDLSAQLNEHVARALRDGLKVPALVQATRLSRADVRRIARCFDDLEPVGLPAPQHLAALARLRTEVAALTEERAAIERQRVLVLAAARRQGLIDDYELASLSGLHPGEIARMTWGVDAGTALPR